MRTKLAVAVLLLLGTLAGCGDDGEDATDDQGTPTTLDPAWQGPGTPLADGLVVPEGALLAGTVFRDEPQNPSDASMPPPPTTAPLPPADDWTALLVVDGAVPFPVLDDLAGQARALGFSLAGTAAGCVVHPRSQGGGGVPESIPVVEAPADLDVKMLECSALASDGFRSLQYELRWSEDTTATVVVTGGRYEAPVAITYTATGGHGRGVDRPLPPNAPVPSVPETLADWTIPSEEPLPADIEVKLPRPKPHERPEPGELFGGTCNCLADRAERLRLPEGMRLVATQASDNGMSVLAVDDPDAALDALIEAAGGGRRRDPSRRPAPRRPPGRRDRGAAVGVRHPRGGRQRQPAGEPRRGLRPHPRVQRLTRSRGRRHAAEMRT